MSTKAPLRVGVVGCGRMGRHHVRVASQADGAELVAIADGSEERRTTLAEQFGGRPCASLDELLAVGVQAIVVATPTVTHRDIVLQAAAAGVHCLVEKPLAPDERTATEMAEAAARCGVALQVGHEVELARVAPVDAVGSAVGQAGVAAQQVAQLVQAAGHVVVHRLVAQRWQVLVQIGHPQAAGLP